MAYKDKEKKAAYDARPENKARAKLRQQTPESKAKSKMKRQTPEAKARQAAYMTIYDAQLERKAKAKLRGQSPEVKAKAKAKRQIPEYRAKLKANREMPEVKARAKVIKDEYRNRSENKIKMTEYGAIYSKTPKRKAQQKLYQLTPAAKIKANANWSKKYYSDPQFKMIVLIRRRLQLAIKSKQKKGSAIKLLGCSINELIIRFEGLFTEGMTWANHGEWHIDHIRPLSSFDLEDLAQLSIACHYTNLQPLWAEDNLTKNNKLNWKKELNA